MGKGNRSMRDASEKEEKISRRDREAMQLL